MSQANGTAADRSAEDDRREFRAWMMSLGTPLAAAGRERGRDVAEKIAMAICAAVALALYIDLFADDALSFAPVAMVALAARAAYLLGTRAGREVGSRETGARWAAGKAETRARRID
jgi:hypothetical protein